MRVHSLPLLVFTAITNAFKLPDGLPDGFYKAYYNEDGIEVHEPVAPGELQTHTPIDGRASSRSVTESNSRISIRQDLTWTFWCGCGWNLNHDNCDAAVQDLKNQAGSDIILIDSYMSYYSIRGDAVAFACNMGGGPEPFSAAAMTTMASYITTKCGWYVAGSANREWGVSLNLVSGYMNYNSGLDFCSASISSSAHYC